MIPSKPNRPRIRTGNAEGITEYYNYSPLVLAPQTTRPPSPVLVDLGGEFLTEASPWKSGPERGFLRANYGVQGSYQGGSRNPSAPHPTGDTPAFFRNRPASTE